MNDLLKYKPVNNRRSRPEWALDDKQLMLRCVGKRGLLRFQVAQMYWQQNKSAREIAETLSLTVATVDRMIHRLVSN